MMVDHKSKRREGELSFLRYNWQNAVYGGMGEKQVKSRRHFDQNRKLRAKCHPFR